MLIDKHVRAYVNDTAWIRRIRTYYRGNQNPYIGEEQTTKWSKEKVPKDKQRSTKPGWTTYVIHPGVFFIEHFIIAEIVQPSDNIKLDPASKGNIVGMIRQMTTAF